MNFSARSGECALIVKRISLSLVLRVAAKQADAERMGGWSFRLVGHPGSRRASASIGRLLTKGYTRLQARERKAKRKAKPKAN